MEKTDVKHSTYEKQVTTGKLNSENLDQKHNIKRKKLERPVKNKNAIARTKCKLCGTLFSASQMCCESKQTKRDSDEEESETVSRRSQNSFPLCYADLRQPFRNADNVHITYEDTPEEKFAYFPQYTDDKWKDLKFNPHYDLEQTKRESDENESDKVSRRSQRFCQKGSVDLYQLLKNAENDYRISEDTTEEMFANKSAQYTDNKGKGLKFQPYYTSKQRNQDSYEIESDNVSRRSQNVCPKGNADLCQLLSKAEKNYRTYEDTTVDTLTYQFPQYNDDERKDLKFRFYYDKPFFPT